MPSTLWLSCHVDYACRHSGVCCRAGWPLPVEDAVVPGIAAALAEGRLATIDGRRVWLAERRDAPEGVAGTLRQIDGACVFHRQRDGGTEPAGSHPASPGAGRPTPPAHECAVHASLGHAALPSTCQHFPRVCLVDDRGVRVSLSHVCPTAASMLVGDDRPVTIVPGPPAVPGRAIPEGLDARGQLPPRLSDRVLADWDGLTAWEAHVVEALAGPSADDAAPAHVLAQLRTRAEVLSQWTPAAGPLTDAVARLAVRAPDIGDRAAHPAAHAEAARRHRHHALVRARCREPWTWPEPPIETREADPRWVAPTWAEHARVVRRYLAARAFGAWASYRLDAARGWVDWVTLVMDVLRVECALQCRDASRALDRELLTAAIGRADLLLLHYADDAASVTASPGVQTSGPSFL